MPQPQQQMPFSRCKHCTSFSPFKAALLEKVRRLIREELRRFDADRTGIVDYALKSSERKCCGALTGECWTFCGGHGYLTIGLSQRINVSAVSYEHLPVESRRNKQIRSGVPRNFIVSTLPFCPTSCCPSCRCFFFADFSLFVGTLVMPLPARHASGLSLSYAQIPRPPQKCAARTDQRIVWLQHMKFFVFDEHCRHHKCQFTVHCLPTFSSTCSASLTILPADERVGTKTQIFVPQVADRTTTFVEPFLQMGLSNMNQEPAVKMETTTIHRLEFTLITAYFKLFDPSRLHLHKCPRPVQNCVFVATGSAVTVLFFIFLVIALQFGIIVYRVIVLRVFLCQHIFAKPSLDIGNLTHAVAFCRIVSAAHPRKLVWSCPVENNVHSSHCFASPHPSRTGP
ncbi:hypothetical protein niasHT_002876 [Heterodera trifolii]|uniref:SUN domain-containing protein n=1 Tax=Heterodera trifolii TaxID=157864 RepID=A0ABD2M6B5_9BILA